MSTKKQENETKLEAKESNINIEGIAPELGINYPFPPALKYSYPEPNEKIIRNIAHALLHDKKFYTNTLNLMNKMNLPPPFEMDKEIEKRLEEDPGLSLIIKKKDPLLASDESEMELSEDENLAKVKLLSSLKKRKK
ncbi:hypothetical protein K502DRAFT_365520 [Neoconidiobolus thromboides FSU 785]|nr:hypothetical protein K502DRAFT_365520 [Neoconidiobolus thromboides FSU 785]